MPPKARKRAGEAWPAEKLIGRRTELLAPAGETAAAYAAFAYGADAIYTGLPRFSARADAINVTPRELEEVIAYAHGLPRPRRVYVAINTLVREDELPELIGALGHCAEYGADALIVQDLGVARLVRRHFPKLKLHASTQMAIHNLEGARAALRLGFQRVILARELTLQEIRRIAREVAPEVEVFIHGALCYSYSGLCLYSALLRGRSGNRGACAYPCRDFFLPVADGRANRSAAAHDGEPSVGFGKIHDSNTAKLPAVIARGGLVFSMKDLAAGERIGELAASGVAALKIEGRKKSPLYVAAAVNYYRKWLDQSFGPGELEQCEADLRAIFSRPWTELYLGSRGQRGPVASDRTGHRGVPVGRVERSDRGFLQFRPALPLEVHDGLQVELAGMDRPYGFAVKQLILSNGRRVFAAGAGERVRVPLPAEAPAIAPGTELFLASSQVVKRRYGFTRPNPRDLRRRYSLDLRVQTSGDWLETTATVAVDGREFLATVRRPGPFAPAQKPGEIRRTCEAVFSRLGGTPFTLRALRADDPLPFVPISQLNEIRRELVQQLAEKIAADRARQREKILAGLARLAVAEPVAKPPEGILLKTDQPSVVWAALAGGPHPPVAEWIIELGRESVEQIEAVLAALPRREGIRLALPIITRAWEREELRRQIRHFIQAGCCRWEAANLSALEFLPAAAGLDLTADWPLYTCNSAAVAAWGEAGFRRFTVAPEDTLENVAVLAARFPGRLVWPVLSDPPLFLSETPPGGGAFPPEGEVRWRSRSGEYVRTLSRGGRYYTLADRPQLRQMPGGVVMIPRADFRLRRWTPESIRHLLAQLPPLRTCQPAGQPSS